MRTRLASRTLVLLLSAYLLFAGAAPALADHTNPREPLSSTEGQPGSEPLTAGEGTWAFIKNFAPNPGTDLEFFKKGGALFMTSGTLGQADEQHVGQRVIKLVNRKGNVVARWWADHGSANCPTANPSGTTGLQHDVQVTPKKKPQLLIDATDATGRCHDSAGGGLELVDIRKIHRKKSEPREVHLTRHQGTSHNVTVDATRPWIVYNSSSSFTAMPWIDVMDIRTCLDGKKVLSIKKKRARCRPKVYRILFKPEWSQQVGEDGELVANSEASCHDITAVPGRIYCAGLNATLIFDVSGLTKKSGAVKGQPLPCEVVDGTLTEAKVTDCNAIEGDVPLATGWKFLGSFNHPGRNCGGGTTNCNNNLIVPSREGVAVAHESDPTHDGQYMFVTDERGGGIVPGGASCSQADNPYGNGGVHVFDISDPSKIEYALTPDDQKAVFVGEVLVPSGTFCTSHVMELIPKEQRFVIAWYSQGIKIVDYAVDENGRFTFTETASIVLPAAQTWAAEQFKIVKNDDGTNTYFIAASDIERGIDVVSWTGPPNPSGPSSESVRAAPEVEKASHSARSDGDLARWLSGLFLSPIAARRLRRR